MRSMPCKIEQGDYVTTAWIQTWMTELEFRAEIMGLIFSCSGRIPAPVLGSNRPTGWFTPESFSKFVPLTSALVKYSQRAESIPIVT